ncbi:MAG: DUF2759 family protein [Paenibacillaceae bacterium]
MLFAEDAVTPAPMAIGTFNLFGFTIDIFDLFVIAFTILIAVGVYRSLKAKQKNVIAIGFGGIALLVFVIMDIIMVKNWLWPIVA